MVDGKTNFFAGQKHQEERCSFPVSGRLLCTSAVLESHKYLLTSKVMGKKSFIRHLRRMTSQLLRFQCREMKKFKFKAFFSLVY